MTEAVGQMPRGLQTHLTPANKLCFRGEPGAAPQYAWLDLNYMTRMNIIAHLVDGTRFALVRF